MKTTISACASAATSLSEIRQKRFRPVPKDWFTLEQFKEHQSCGDTFARKAMQSLLIAGKVEVQRWPMLDSGGKVYYKNIYRNK